MSPRLKPLLLPQLVEKRILEEQMMASSLAALNTADPDDGAMLGSVYCGTDSSSSDVATPLTPTFSPRGHARFGSSCSSLDLASVPSSSEGPASPPAAPKSAKRSLPDVEEEPLERDDEDTLLPDELYCLCDETCIHRDEMVDFAIGYDLGFMSEGDYASSDRFSIKRRGHDSSSSFSGIASRLGSRFPNFTKWRSSSRRATLTASPTCELTFEHAYPASHAAGSSRSSSLSAPSQAIFDRPGEPLPTTPELSFWESTESVGVPTAIDIEAANSVRQSIERDRALATTPLLPPLMTGATEGSAFSSPPPLPPLHSAPLVDARAHAHAPPLSTRPSVSSFHPSLCSPCTPVTPELPSAMPALLLEGDAWSDRLGHANFTISPQPYEPDFADLDSLRKLRADWNQAYINYTKHVVRTRENYGQTSKIYGLTEAKWAETQRSWKLSHDSTMERILAGSSMAAPHQASKSSASGSRSRSRGRGRSGRPRANSTSGGDSTAGRPSMDELMSAMEWRRVEDDMPTAICRMLEADKFPARGDEDIVGPMERDAVMVRANSEERKRSRFWRSIVDKVRK